MLLARVRRFAASHHTLWCVLGMLLILLQPFIAVHFRCDGLEDEPMLRVRSLSDTVQFEADDRADHPADHETTVFAQAPASIDHPDAFDFAAGLSSSFGWGSFDNPTSDDGDDTLIDRYRGAGVRETVLYVDSGGNDATVCADTDNDGIEDDVNGGDNYCETAQMRDVLLGEGYVLDDNFFYEHDRGLSGTGAEHREEAWEFRARTIIVPLFMGL